MRFTSKGFVALLVTVALVMSFAGMALAADPTEATPTAPAVAAASNDITFPGVNLQGDTGFIFSRGKLAAGIGSDLAQWKDGLITLRAEGLATDDGHTFAGVGPMVNIPKLVTTFGGGEWTNTVINPSLGIVGGYDFQAGRFDAAVVLSVVKVAF